MFYVHRSKSKPEYNKETTYVSTDSNPVYYDLDGSSQPTTATSPPTAKQDIGTYELCDVQDKETPETLYEDV